MKDALLQRVAGHGREPVDIFVDGQPVRAQVGDTVLTAMLTHGQQLRRNEFSGAPRAGFCLMGACQDCWVETESGQRLRACGTAVEPGMRLRSASTT